jgi:hypothetical protein
MVEYLEYSDNSIVKFSIFSNTFDLRQEFGELSFVIYSEYITNTVQYADSIDLRKSKEISLSKLVSYVFKSEAELRMSLKYRGRISKNISSSKKVVKSLN